MPACHHDRRRAGRDRAAEHDAAAQRRARTLDKSLNEKPVERADESGRQDPERQDRSENAPRRKRSWRPPPRCMPSGVTPLSPSALSAAVAPSTSATRANLRVVPNPRRSPPRCRPPPPLTARIAEAPMVPPPTAPRDADRADAFAIAAHGRRRRPWRPSCRSPRRRRATKNTSSACWPWTTAR